MSISIEQIRQLPADQQLSLPEQIWDGLLASGQLLQQWHIDEVRARVKELDHDPNSALTEAEMWRLVNELDNTR